MITIKDFMDAVGYRITEGSEFGWHCFGPDAFSIDSWDGDQNGHSASLTFDTKTQTAYVMEVCDYANERAYRFVNPEYSAAFLQEAKAHNALLTAWDEINYIDLETQEDILEKTQAIFENREYDTRVQVPLEMSDKEIFRLMQMAHDRDITLNQLVCDMLTEVINKKVE